MNKSSAVFSLVLVLSVGGVLVFQQALSGSQPSVASSTNNLNEEPGLVPSGPIPVNTIAYVEKAVQADLVVPNAGVLGSGFRVIGAKVAQNPTSDTLSGGVTYDDWVVAIYITDEPFVNGTTTYSELFSGVIIVSEAPAAPGTNSYDAARAALQPSQTCVGRISSANTTSSTCSYIQGPSQSLVQIGDTYLAVTPSAPSAFFMIGTDGPVVMISPRGPSGINGSTLLSYQQMLALASDMISTVYDSSST